MTENVLSRAIRSLSGELHAFLSAIVYYTRLRLPRPPRHDDDVLRRTSVWFPAVGWIVGSIVAGAAGLASLRLPSLLVATVSTIVGILLTGAIHEDGLADTCDAMGGGTVVPREQILHIMKDSRVGSYGVLGLVLILITKIAALVALLDDPAADRLTRSGHAVLILIVAHTISRATAISLLSSLKYVRTGGDSKAKALATPLGAARLLGVFALGLLPALAVFASWRGFVVVPTCVALHLCAHRFFRRRLGGVTGDCLGATQQIAEVAIYLSLLAVMS